MNYKCTLGLMLQIFMFQQVYLIGKKSLLLEPVKDIPVLQAVTYLHTIEIRVWFRPGLK